MAASRTELLRLLDKLENPVLREFRAAVAGMRSRASVARLTRAIERNDLDAAFYEAGIRPGQWAPLAEQLRNAYVEAGVFSIASDVPKRFGKTFNPMNPRAQAWLLRKSSTLIEGLDSSQRKAIRTVLEAGMASGRGPRTTALDIVGRVSAQTGRRTGGVLGLSGSQGLTGSQAQYVVNARTQLEQLDPAYFNRTRRDRRLDPLVRNAIKTKTPLSPDQVNMIIGRYEDRLLQTRGETIARTETLAAMNEAADEALRQVVEEGLAPAEAVERVWNHSFSLNEREGHKAMHGQVRGVGEPFVNPLTRAMLMHPGDGPASEVINCRCIVTHRINFSAVEMAS